MGIFWQACGRYCTDLHVFNEKHTDSRLAGAPCLTYLAELCSVLLFEFLTFTHYIYLIFKILYLFSFLLNLLNRNIVFMLQVGHVCFEKLLMKGQKTLCQSTTILHFVKLWRCSFPL